MISDTIFALASGRPPAAIAIVRVSGPSAHEAGQRLAGDLPPSRTASFRELRNPVDDSLLDQAVVLRFDGPASSTGEDVVEFQVHGGQAVVDSVFAALTSLEGVRIAEPGEFTRRAFQNGRIDLTEAEGLADLLAAETETQRRVAIAIAEGGLRRQIDIWQQRLLDLSGKAEAAIDYVDDGGIEHDINLSSKCGALALELQEWLDRPLVEPLRDGVRVTIAGPPNSGKSSLLNAITGTERAIVTSIPGTTRDHIEAPLAIAGIPMLLTDTAGLRESDDPIESIGITRSKQLIAAADILIWVGEADDAPAHPRLIKAHSRCDLEGREAAPSGSIRVSAVTGEGVANLLIKVGELAQSVIPAEGALALNRRQAQHLFEARAELRLMEGSNDLVLLAEHLRAARSAFDRLTGRAGVEDVLDALFSRFCLGK